MTRKEGMMTTLSKINKYLKSNNIDAEILPGKGYVYFAGPDTSTWKNTTVPGIPNVKNLTTAQGKELFSKMLELNAW